MQVLNVNVAACSKYCIVDMIQDFTGVKSGLNHPDLESSLTAFNRGFNLQVKSNYSNSMVMVAILECNSP